MRAYLLAVCGVLLLAAPCAASQIDPISLAELEARATHVVLARVTKVAETGNTDNVTIHVSAYLKGKSDKQEFTFSLVTRGGIKDFDPAVKVGDTGVFFLREADDKSHVHKAYWGSIAIFPKHHFDVPDKKAAVKAKEE